MTDPNTPSLILSSSPHIRSGKSIESAMYHVLAALLPALAGAVVFFGLDALRVAFWAVGGCLAFEAMCLRMAGKPRVLRTLADGSAILTGVLLAMNLPSSVPWWLVLAGAFVAMIVAKHVFGGLGANPFNPALVARIFLLIAWPARMTHWPAPRFFPATALMNADGVTAATPLGILAAAETPAAGVKALEAQFAIRDLFLGNIGGSLGETSALLLLIGGLFLIGRRIIRWEIPVAYIGTMGLLSTIAWAIKPEVTANPAFHLLAGGLFLGAFFMATDYVTSPMSPPGMLVFGIGCGILTFLIRFFGGYPEGVSFAIVIMNALVALIDRYIIPRREGLRAKATPQAPAEG
jgi:electron transport complex protein RnfD